MRSSHFSLHVGSRALALAWALGALLSSACTKNSQSGAEPAWTLSSADSGPLAQKSKKATEKHDAAWATCHQSVKPTGKGVEADVSALAKSCEAVTQMKRVGSTIVGKRDAENQPQTIPFQTEARKCYRVYAAGNATVGDLDLVIKDSNGDVVGEDSTDDPTPVLAEDGALCFKVADAATLAVSIGAGKGSYALEIWSD